MADWPEQSVHICVSSPPYWGLRNFNIPPRTWPDGSICSFGSEPTLDLYVQHSVVVLRAIWRVLRDDGTCWWNLGDKYFSGGGLRPKDLVMIPARVALAAQADGWYLRSQIIWVKPNPMPEGAKDRPTSSYDLIYLLTKKSKYYFDVEAVKEEYIENGVGSGKFGRNIRNVWTIPTERFKGAHFATFPARLVKPCIKSGTSEYGVCAECGSQWKRIIEKSDDKIIISRQGANAHNAGKIDGFSHYDNEETAIDVKGAKMNIESGLVYEYKTLGWQPSCKCNAAVVPAIVCDPFMGSGTTAIVARRLGRYYLGCELNPDYVKIAENRLIQEMLI